MNGFAFVNLCAAALLAFWGLSVLLQDPRARTTRVFFYTTLCFAWWGVTYAFMQNAPDEASYRAWYRAGALAWIVGPSQLLLFFLSLTTGARRDRRAWLHRLVHLPPAGLLLRWLLHGQVFSVAVTRGPLGWIETPAADDPWFIAFSVYFLGYALAGLAAAWSWGRATVHPRIRAQAHALFLGGTTTVFLVALLELLLPQVGLQLPVVSPAIVTVWIGVIWWVTRGTGLARLTLAAAADEIIATMNDGLLLTDPDGRIVRSNAAANRMFGWTGPTRPVSGQRLFGESRASDETRLARFLADGPVPHFETLGRRGKEEFPLFLSAAAVRDRRGVELGRVLVLRDASELRRAEQRVHHVAHHDALTDLPNRLLFGDRLAHDLARARRYREPLAVLALDLDRFKEINDTAGHEAGDIVLRAVAARLLRCVRKSDTVARVGGDEFVVALPDLKRPEDAAVVADRILAAVAEPVEFGDRRLAVGVTIGIALFPEHGDDPALLLRRADTALFAAKAAGRGCWRTFDPAAGEGPAAPVRITAERVREALERHELSLAWQPIVAVADRRVVAVEALVRWNHPELGELPATAFLPAAADAGQLLPICEWVTRTACAQARAWDTAGLRRVPVAVNLCTRALFEPELPARLAELLRQTGLEPARLQLELTEDVVLGAAEHPDLLHNLTRLRDLGLTLTLDDFGTGPTSLTALSRVPLLRTLKIGRTFATRRRPGSDPAALLRAITVLARGIGFEQVIVEGVESEAELDLARAAGCDAVQGYHVGRPAGAHAVAHLLQSELDSAP